MAQLEATEPLLTESSVPLTDSDTSEWVLADSTIDVSSGDGPQLEGGTSNAVQSLTMDTQVQSKVHHKLQMEVDLAFPVVGMSATTLQAVLSVIAPSADGFPRAPLRLVAVLDKSGSMHGKKLQLVIQTMHFVVRYLGVQDALGIVAYDTEVTVLAPLTFCTPEGRVHLEAAINRLRSGSQTNLSGGLLKGIELHREGVLQKPLEALPCALQRLTFGNAYRKLSKEELEQLPRYSASSSSDSEDHLENHSWTMKLLTELPEDMTLIKKVVYHLHPTFAQQVVEVSEAPFELERHGWGTFEVKADVHLHDGRRLSLTHDLCFRDSGSFQTLLLPLRSPAAPTVRHELGNGSKGSLGDAQPTIRSTFLFTDGLANVGIQKPEDICKAAQSMLEALGDQKCTVSTFGFGDDHNADLLKSVAEIGGGEYNAIENEDQIGQAFGEALGGVLSTTHQNTRLSLELAPGITVKAQTDFLVDSPYVVDEDGTQVVHINLGDLFAEERRDILVTFSLLEATTETEKIKPIAHIYTRAFSVLSCSSEETVPQAVTVQRSSSAGNSIQAPSLQVERHRNRYTATTALKSANELARFGNLSEARQCLSVAIEALSSSVLSLQGDELSVGLLADLNDCFKDLRHQDLYYSKGSKKMNNLYHGHSKQRACNNVSTEMYSCPQARSMKSGFSMIQ